MTSETRKSLARAALALLVLTWFAGMGAVAALYLADELFPCETDTECECTLDCLDAAP